jgi:hypothetical protein
MSMTKSSQGNRTSRIAIEVTAEELKLLTSLAADQLFRREFIDPKMPGFKSNTAEVTMGKALLERLRALNSDAQPNPRSQRRAV